MTKIPISQKSRVIQLKKGNFQIQGSSLSLEATSGSHVNFISCASIAIYQQQIDGQQTVLSPLAMSICSMFFPDHLFLPLPAERPVFFGSIEAKMFDAGYAPGSSFLKITDKKSSYLYVSKFSFVQNPYIPCAQVVKSESVYLKVSDFYTTRIEALSNLSPPENLLTNLQSLKKQGKKICIAVESLGEFLCLLAQIGKHFKVSCEQETIALFNNILNSSYYNLETAQRTRKAFEALSSNSKFSEVHLFSKNLLLLRPATFFEDVHYFWFGDDYSSWSHLNTTKNCPWVSLPQTSWGGTEFDIEMLVKKSECQRVYLIGKENNQINSTFAKLKIPHYWISNIDPPSLF